MRKEIKDFKKKHRKKLYLLISLLIIGPILFVIAISIIAPSIDASFVMTGVGIILAGILSLYIAQYNSGTSELIDLRLTNYTKPLLLKDSTMSKRKNSVVLKSSVTKNNACSICKVKTEKMTLYLRNYSNCSLINGSIYIDSNCYNLQRITNINIGANEQIVVSLNYYQGTFVEGESVELIIKYEDLSQTPFSQKIQLVYKDNDFSYTLSYPEIIAENE